MTYFETAGVCPDEGVELVTVLEGCEGGHLRPFLEYSYIGWK